MTSPLHNRRILVVEDEYAIAASLVAALEIVGSAAVGPAPSVKKALEAIETETPHRRGDRGRQPRRRDGSRRRGQASGPEHPVRLHFGL